MATGGAAEARPAPAPAASRDPPLLRARSLSLSLDKLVENEADNYDMDAENTNEDDVLMCAPATRRRRTDLRHP